MFRRGFRVQPEDHMPLGRDELAEVGEGETGETAELLASNGNFSEAFSSLSRRSRLEEQGGSLPSSLNRRPLPSSLALLHQCASAQADESQGQHIVKPKGIEDGILSAGNQESAHKGGVSSLALSSDGQVLVSSGEDNKIRIWEQQEDDSWNCDLPPLDLHSGVVYSVTLSNDRRRLASSSDMEVFVWELRSREGDDEWRRAASLPNYTEEVFCVSLSPDGRKLITGSDDSNVLIWDLGDLDDPKIEARLIGHTQGVGTVVMSRDCKRAYSGSMDNSIKIWDTETCECVATLVDHTDTVNALALSANGLTLASGSEDMSIRIWDLQKNECMAVLTGHMNWVLSVALSSNGQYLVSGCLDGTIKFWDTRSQLCISTLEGHDKEVWAVALSSDNRWLYSGSEDSTIRKWDLERGECVTNLEDFNDDDGDISLALSKNGRTLVCAPKDECVMSVWDLMMGNRVQELKGHNGPINDVVLSSDGRKLASASQDGTVMVWNPQRDDAEPITLPQNQNRAADNVLDWTAVAMSGSGHRIASSCGSGTIYIWYAEQVDSRNAFDDSNMDPGWKQSNPLQSHTDVITSLAFSFDGKILASGSMDQTIGIAWNLGSESVTTQPVAVEAPVLCVTISKSGYRVAACMKNKNAIQVWTLEWSDYGSRTLDIQPFVTLDDGVTAPVAFVRMANDGKRLISADEKNVRVWDVDVEQCIATLEGHPNKVSSVVPTGDGQGVVSGSVGGKYDKRVLVWDTGSGQCVANLQVNDDTGVTSVAISNSGEYLYTACFDKCIRRWALKDGENDQNLEGHNGPVTAMALSKEGKLLVSGSTDASVKLWNLEGSINTLAAQHPHESSDMEDMEANEDDSIVSIAISDNEQFIASGTRGGKIEYLQWSEDVGVILPVDSVDDHNGAVMALILADGGERLISASADSTIKIWDFRVKKGGGPGWKNPGDRDGECLATLEGHGGEVNTIALSTDGRRLVSGSADKTIKIWDMASSKCTATLTGHTLGVRYVVLSSDSRFVVSGSLDMHIKIWDMGSGSCISTLDGLEDEISCLALSPDDRKLYSGYPDGKVKVWQLGSGGPSGMVMPGSRERALEKLGKTTETRVLRGGTDTSTTLPVKERSGDVHTLSAGVKLREKLLEVALVGQHATTFFLPVSGKLTEVELRVISNEGQDEEVLVICHFTPKFLGINKKKPSISMKYMSWLGDLPRGRVGRAPICDAPPVHGIPSVLQGGTGLGGHVSFLHHLTWLDDILRDKICRQYNTGYLKAVQSVPGLRAALRVRDLRGCTPLGALLSHKSVRPADLSDLLMAYAHDAAESKRLKDVVALEECLDCVIRCLPHIERQGLSMTPVWEMLASCGHVTVAEFIPGSMAKESLPHLGYFFTTFLNDGSKTKWLSEEQGRQKPNVGGSRYNLMLFGVRKLFSERPPGIIHRIGERETSPDAEPFVLWDFIVDNMPAKYFESPLMRAATDFRTPYLSMIFFLTVHIGQTACLFLMMLGNEETVQRVVIPQLILGCVVLVDEIRDLIVTAQTNLEHIPNDASNGGAVQQLLKRVRESWNFLGSFFRAFTSYFKDIYNIIELYIAICPILLVVFRTDQDSSGEEIHSFLPAEQATTLYWVILALALLLASLKFVSFMRSVPYFAGIVKMMERIIVMTIPDMLFLLLLSGGFSAATHALLTHFAQDYYELAYQYTLLRFLTRWVLSDGGIFEIEDDPVIEGTEIVEEDGSFLDKPERFRFDMSEDMPFGWLPYIIFIGIQVLYVYLVIIVFLNLIIARMGSFYEDVKDNQLSETIQSCARTYESSYHRHWDRYIGAVVKLFRYCTRRQKREENSILSRWCPCDEESWDADDSHQADNSTGQLLSDTSTSTMLATLQKQLEAMDQRQRAQTEAQRKQGALLKQLPGVHQRRGPERAESSADLRASRIGKPRSTLLSRDGAEARQASGPRKPPHHVEPLDQAPTVVPTVVPSVNLGSQAADPLLLPSTSDSGNANAGNAGVDGAEAEAKTEVEEASEAQRPPHDVEPPESMTTLPNEVPRTDLENSNIPDTILPENADPGNADVDSAPTEGQASD